MNKFCLQDVEVKICLMEKFGNRFLRDNSGSVGTSLDQKESSRISRSDFCRSMQHLELQWEWGRPRVSK